jgi:hypothetical protein
MPDKKARLAPRNRAAVFGISIGSGRLRLPRREQTPAVAIRRRAFFVPRLNKKASPMSRKPGRRCDVQRPRWESDIGEGPVVTERPAVRGRAGGVFLVHARVRFEIASGLLTPVPNDRRIHIIASPSSAATSYAACRTQEQNRPRRVGLPLCPYNEWPVLSARSARKNPSWLVPKIRQLGFSPFHPHAG